MAQQEFLIPINLEEFFPKDFLKKTFRTTHRLMSGAFPPDILTKLINLEILDELILNNSINNKNVKVIKEGRASNDFLLKTAGGQPNYFSIGEQLNKGETLVFDGIQHASLGIKRISNLLEQFTGCKVEVNAYITPKGKTGFPPHFDGHDVIVIQVSGRKIWKIYNHYENKGKYLTDEFLRKLSLEQFKPIEKDVESFEISVGDMLYIPQGTMHAPFCTDDHSFHLTFGLHPVSWGDYIKEACEILKTSEIDFRSPSPVQSFGKKQDFAELKKTLPKLLKKIADLDPGLVEHRSFRRAVARNGVFTKAPIHDALIDFPSKDLKTKSFSLILTGREDLRVFETSDGDWKVWVLDHIIDLDPETAKLIFKLRDNGIISSQEMRKKLGKEEAANIADICRKVGIAWVKFE